MTDDFYQAAEHFGLTREEADAHRQAWEDLNRMHAGPFCIQTVRELHAALRTVIEAGEPIDPATWRRLEARSTIIGEMAAAAEHDILDGVMRDYNGPAH